MVQRKFLSPWRALLFEQNSICPLGFHYISKKMFDNHRAFNNSRQPSYWQLAATATAASHDERAGAPCISNVVPIKDAVVPFCVTWGHAYCWENGVVAEESDLVVFDPNLWDVKCRRRGYRCLSSALSPLNDHLCISLRNPGNEISYK